VYQLKYPISGVTIARDRYALTEYSIGTKMSSAPLAFTYVVSNNNSLLSEVRRNLLVRSTCYCI